MQVILFTKGFNSLLLLNSFYTYFGLELGCELATACFTHLDRVLTLQISILFTCPKNREYYTDRGFEQKRLPLIKPYELTKVSATEWRMELMTTQLLALSVHNVQRVNVMDKFTLIHSVGGTDLNQHTSYDCWFIINQSTNKEEGFGNLGDYHMALYKMQISDTTLLKPDSVYDKFYDTKLLPWTSKSHR